MSRKRILGAAVVAAVLLSTGSAVAAPGNDDIANATPILSVPFTDTVSTQGASRESGEPRPCGGIGATVWYSFTPTIEGYVIAHTLGSDFDTALAVYRGSLFDLSEVRCDTDSLGQKSRVKFYAYPGETMYFQAGGEWGDSGNLTFSLARPASVEGTVTDATDGNELSDICVEVFSTTHTRLATTWTDGEGDYFVGDLPEGAVKVRFTDCVEGAYAREWFDDATSFAAAQPVVLVGNATTGAVDAALGIRQGPDMAVLSVTVQDVPLQIGGTPVPVPGSYNRDVVVTTRNDGPLAGRRVHVRAEACPRTMGSCDVLGDRWVGRVEPGEESSVTFHWNGLATLGDVALIVTVAGTRDMDWDDNVAESDRYVWVGGTGFGGNLCGSGLGSVGCL